MKKSIKTKLEKESKLWHQRIAYVSKNVLHCLFNSWSQLCYVDKCKTVMLPSSETFHLRTYLKSIFKYFVERWKIVPVKECQLSLFMTGRCVLTSIFKITIKFAFFWYIACLVPKISNIFEKYPLISWSITKEFYYDVKSSKSPQCNDFFRTCYFYRGLMLSDGHLKEIEIATTECKQHFNWYIPPQEDHLGWYFRRETRKWK